MGLYNKKTLASILLCSIGYVCVAQGSNPPPPMPPPPPGLPIDNGLIILFIVALIYGIVKNIKISKN